MNRKERKLYKSGKRNPDGYSFKPIRLFKNKWAKFTFCVLIIFAYVFSLLSIFGVTSWNKLFSSLSVINTVQEQDGDFAVYCLDVGQSDCTIIKCEDKVMMIDTGTTNQLYQIRTALFALDIEQIDYMVITHQHDDHMSGATELIKHYNVSNILMPRLSDINEVDSSTYSNLIKTIADNKVNPIAVSAGDTFELGSSTIEILSPVIQDKELNNMSVVLKITYGDTSFLFQGDSEQSIEKQILNSNFDISADVIKLGHHGSKTSSFAPYLDAVNPKYAIISCNSDNNYGHPNLQVMETLAEKNITPCITSLNGNIIITSDGKEVVVSTSK